MRGLEPCLSGPPGRGCLPVQVTKNRPAGTDTAYPGLLEPGDSQLRNFVLYRKEVRYLNIISPHR